ncbi:MAG TPA: BTAD domain-containing putative transcriptional regulator [Gaiella sp.]|nr:BTAD domain-containing putative transcriptional regulator [Gaiella sp.]
MDELRVLGPVEVVVDGAPVPLAAMQRRLLAALLVAAGSVRSVDELADALWGEAPPASSRKLLQLYVSQVRKVLPEACGIVTSAGGYALSVEPGHVDSARFEELLAEATDARRTGNPARAGSLAARALSLWRGRAFGDLAYDVALRDEAERLEDLRLAATEERFRAELALGRHDAVVAETVAHAEASPLREPAQELAILALYRAGRQSDALAHYALAHGRLDELGLEPGRALRDLQQQILRHDPALELEAPEAGDAAPLPVPPTTLVGREREVAQLVGLLERHDVRLVVLTGAGGSGKTRLALEAARRAATSFANGAALVELAPLRDPALVAQTILASLGAAPASGEDPAAAVLRAVAAQDLLLVVDNAEHLREAAPLYTELVARAPRLTILVTSRAVLHVSGEHVFPVAPLADGEAVELFVERARLLDPSFARTAENEDDLLEICRRVDGLPLAIELAAARIRTLPTAVLRERLEERLALLTGGPRDLPARQQTLRETIDWSYDLLDDDERALLARLSVFPAGATLDAVGRVCLGGDDARALDLVERLLDASLLVVHDGLVERRYRMLETVRQYAAGRLQDGDGAETARRHAEWCLALAETAEQELSGKDQSRWFATLEAEHDNLRAALDHLGADGDRTLRLRLTVALSRFWYVRGYLSEGRGRLDEALADGDELPAQLLRRAHTASAAHALLQGDYAAATRSSEAALEAARRDGEPRFVANALSNLGAIVLAAGDPDRAAAALEEAVELARDVGDTRIAALAINNLGDVALTTGDYRRARPLFEESHELLVARGDTANIARSLFNRGAVDLMLGDHVAADGRFRDALVLADETGDKEDLAWCLEGLASVAAVAGDGERAATLLGVAGALLAEMGAEFKPFERQLHETTEERARALCGPEEYVSARERGAALSLADGLGVAHGGSPAA